MKIVIGLIVLAVVGFAAWVRLAPTSAKTWHTDPMLAPKGRLGGFALRPGGDADPVETNLSPADLLTRLDEIAMGTPRTKRIAGSVAEGRVTYETRSALWGFPDYTSVETQPSREGSIPVINGRLRFGKGDMGVNRARILSWIAQL